MAERTVEQIVTEAQYAREHAVSAAALPSVLVGWVKALADDVDLLVERLQRAES